MTILTLVAALAAQALPAPGTAHWEAVASDSGGRYELDPASISRDGDRVTARIRATAARTQPDGTRIAVVGFVFDCAARTATMETADFYREDGTFAHTLDVPAAARTAEPVHDNEGDGQVLRRICGGGAPAPL